MNDELMNNIPARPANASEREPIPSLFSVAKRAKYVLAPVPPSPAFRARLKDGLMLAAHHQQTHQMLTDKPSEPTWGWLIGAAALGSAAGIIAFVLRMRAHNHPVASGAEARPS